jgi:hypothetical protein
MEVIFSIFFMAIALYAPSAVDACVVAVCRDRHYW